MDKSFLITLIDAILSKAFPNSQNHSLQFHRQTFTDSNVIHILGERGVHSSDKHTNIISKVGENIGKKYLASV